ncbi:MAG: 23S rRNA (adenine(2503)-C(2))-methyltransferase RlmN [Tissierellia bacterium]|nr:23S rRNA (adenine(2503)-C(2))-methyltransferase RlmN [Tissierellia bacterium]
MELNSMTLKELRNVFQKGGLQTFRGNQLFSFFHNSKRTDIENSNLSKKSLELIKDEKIDTLEIIQVYTSQKDGTKKFLFRLDDGNIIEGVLMKYKHGYSQCISTQVGCKMGCSFCASTKEGLIRNLTPAEMLQQVYQVENKFEIIISNIILMGSGEPLDNFSNVIRFLELLHDEKGHNMSYRNMTLSTCGIAPRVRQLGELHMPINLAVSLHETNNDNRSKLIPINRKYNLENLKDALLDYQKKTKNRITFEYTLIAGHNDKDINVKELTSMTKGLKCHINLIPLNPIEEFNQDRPKREEVVKFKKLLEKQGLQVTIRRELGSDIEASCGQLRRKFERGENIEVCCSN